jgi:Subtilisin-like serine proteases
MREVGLMKRKLKYMIPIILLICILFGGFTIYQNSLSRAVTYNIRDLKESADLRGFILKRDNKSLAGLDLRDKYDILIKTNFDTSTKFPPAEKLPSNFNPLQIITLCQNPGLGVRELHNQGITGKGVNVAIIDQPLFLSHEDYKSKIAKYTVIDCEKVEPQMHASATASLLVGGKCGTAPGASLYFWAVPSWKSDYKPFSVALKQIIEYNKGKTDADKIRIVSVSIGYADSFKNLDLWKETLEEASRNEILVIHCSAKIQGLNCPLFHNVDDPNNYGVSNYINGCEDSLDSNNIFIPVDNRTTAGFNGKNEYVFWSSGGLSWAPPYLTGIVAMGYEVNPNLKMNNVWSYLQETGTPYNRGWILNSQKFIEKVKSTNS